MKNIEKEKEKTLWQGRMVQLLDDIQGWLGSLIELGTVKFSRPLVSRSGEAWGEYEVQSGLIELGRETLQLNPVGIVVGGFRIDADGPKGRGMLFLGDLYSPLPDGQILDSAIWFISHPTRRDLRPLTQGTFQELFIDLFGRGGLASAWEKGLSMAAPRDEIDGE